MTSFALVGNIASGKTAVEEFLREFGYEVLDTDKVAHEILNSHTAQIEKAFDGQDIVTDGKIDRSKLGKIVFADTTERKKLEAVIHPLIRQRIKDYCSGKELSIVAIPLLFEAKMEDLFDKIIFVFADDETRLERLMARNNLTQTEAMMRINSQMSQFTKLEMSDYVFHNNGTLENLKNQVKDFVDKILKELA